MFELKNYNQLKLRILQKDKVSEEDVRQAINLDIKSYLKEKYDMIIDFKNEVLTHKNTLIDSKYGNFIIEYKKPDVNISDKQRNQLIDYLHTLDKYSWGIITNGISLEIYHYSYEEKTFVRNDSFSGEINLEQFTYICNIIANKDNLILTENNINEILGLENNKSIIRKIYSKIIVSTNVRTKLLYSEWQKLFHISDEYDNLDLEKKHEIIKFYEELFNQKINNVQEEYKALFAIQTYYSIILKIVLYKLILNKTKEKFSKPKFVKEMFANLENNSLFRKSNIMNLIDGDFFSWYLDEFSDEEFLYFYNLISDIATIETKKINLLFIKFYENIFPFHVRHAMGEYYTPLYLANSIIENSLNLSSKQNPTILDPTCGSGIFIIHAFNLGYKNIFGIDINPLAVLTSKINYLINNFVLDQPLEIPIYLGDSTYLPTIKNINGINCYDYELITSLKEYPVMKFIFSEDVIKEKHFFAILDEIEQQVKLKNKKGIITVIESYESFHYEELKNHYESLIDDLIYLENSNLNSIWLKIIGNYLKAGSIRNVDCIVGNPPWVRWSNLPDNYKNKIKENCRIEGVFSSDTNSGGVDLNIAALITYISIRDRLSEKGVLGFIMPDSILFNKSFEGFRKMTFANNHRFYLKKVIRWNDKTERPFDPVSIDFAEYYFTLDKPNKVEVFERKNNLVKTAHQLESSFNNHFIVVNNEELKIIQSVLGKNNYTFRSGVSLVKGGHYLLEFVEKISDKVSSFRVYEKSGKRVKISDKVIKLETEIIFPFIKTDMIGDNYIKTTNYYCIFPYPYGSKEPYKLNEIRERFPLFYNYFMSNEIQKSINSSSKYNLRIQKNDTDLGIFRVGEYTYSKYFLATRDNTKSSFSKVGTIKTPWGEDKMPIFDGHINFVSRNEKNEEISEMEVDKLFKVFTQKGVKLYIKYSSDSRSISGRLYNDIKIQ